MMNAKTRVERNERILDLRNLLHNQGFTDALATVDSMLVELDCLQEPTGYWYEGEPIEPGQTPSQFASEFLCTGQEFDLTGYHVLGTRRYKVVENADEELSAIEIASAPAAETKESHGA